ncbi:hypothetical protein JHN55_25315 [Streptomyces sp. MBT56]|nr:MULTISPECIES: hypothetical protein [unclassified Streptomyces]MBK3559785.1 hypothetical protein [Streptomyces sp. MBT56]MBK3601273.1 hypothetical protein [Streptomyces sp. MBT54]
MADMIALAEREGFTLHFVFIEKQPQRAAALNALVRYCQDLRIQNVVVPTNDHLNTLPALADVSRAVLQEEIGGQVWIVAPTDEETLCPPTT